MNRQHEKLFPVLIGIGSDSDGVAVSFLQLSVCHEADGADGGGAFSWHDMWTVQMVYFVRIYDVCFDRQYGRCGRRDAPFPVFFCEKRIPGLL